MAIEHADFDGIERLALVTGGDIVSTFDNPDMVKLGKCQLIEQVNSPILFVMHRVFLEPAATLKTYDNYMSVIAFYDVT